MNEVLNTKQNCNMKKMIKTILEKRANTHWLFIKGIALKHLIITFLLFSFQTSFSQSNREIKGVVLSEDGTPVADCSIMLKGSSKGATSDNEGKFMIEVPNAKSVLQLSHVGYQIQEFVVGQRTEFTVTLKKENSTLSDVVVVGYGTQKKSSLTSSISTIKGQDMAAQPVADLSNSLGGRAAGIIFTQGSGEPGYDGSNILIRGIGTTGNTQPLVIVDGIPRNFTQLDPNTIASVTILKDAAAVAPYGLGGQMG